MKNYRSILKMAALLTVVSAAADVRVALAQTDLTTGHTVDRVSDGATLFVASPPSDLQNVVRAADGTISSAESNRAMTQSPLTSAGPNARFVEEDSAFGPGTITLDTVTGFRWLDLTVTEPFTYNEVVAELGPGGMFDGYRLGLDVEVEEVMNAFGVVGYLPAQPIHDEFIGFFGITNYQDQWPQTFGYASPLMNGMAPVFGLDFLYSNGAPTYLGETGGLLHNPNYNFKGFGTWILRVIAPATCLGLTCTINGKSSETIIQGTNGDDVICGTDKNDIILGKGGNDTICGNAGDDVILADNGHDRVDGGPGNDVLDGGTGMDMLDGSEGNDILLGGNDSDLLYGGMGFDHLSGGLGQDMLNGGPDDDICEKENSDKLLVSCENKVSSTNMSILTLDKNSVSPELAKSLNILMNSAKF